MPYEADLLPRRKPQRACLSQWQLSRLALRLLPDPEAAAARHHLDGCAFCTQLFAAEEQGVAQAATLPLPAALQQRRGRRWPWAALSSGGAPGRAWRPAAGLAVALGVVLMAVAVLPERRQETIVLKGAPSLMVRQRTAGGTEREVALEELGQPTPGDRLQLRMPGGRATWQALLVQQEGETRVLFAGPLAANAYVPVGLTVTAGAPSALRLVVCASAVPVAALVRGETPAGCEVYHAHL